MIRERLLVVGVGNDTRGDDGIGLVLVKELLDSGRMPEGVEAVCHSGDGMTLMGRWSGFGCVLIVDAMRSGGRAGDSAVYDVADRAVPLGAFSGVSSHGLGVAEAVELARALGRLPRKIRIFGVEGHDMSDSARLSSELLSRLPDIRSHLASVIESMQLE